MAVRGIYRRESVGCARLNRVVLDSRLFATCGRRGSPWPRGSAPRGSGSLRAQALRGIHPRRARPGGAHGRNHSGLRFMRNRRALWFVWNRRALRFMQNRCALRFTWNRRARWFVTKPPRSAVPTEPSRRAVRADPPHSQVIALANGNRHWRACPVSTTLYKEAPSGPSPGAHRRVVDGASSVQVQRRQHVVQARDLTGRRGARGLTDDRSTNSARSAPA